MAADDDAGRIAAAAGGAVSWDASAYARHNAHHRAFDGHVLDGLSLRGDERVLDVGCGTGEFTARLAAELPRGHVVGIDADDDMIRKATDRHASSTTRFVHCRAQELPRVAAGNRFDVVVSVAALHWIPRAEHPTVLRQIAEVLRDGSVFRADLGGAGQIGAARALLDELSLARGGNRAPWYFPTPEDYAALLGQAGMEVTSSGGRVRLVRQRRRLPDVDALRGWLDSQVLIAYRPGLPETSTYQDFREEALRRAATELRRSDGSYDQDYVRLDVLARRRRDSAGE
jgi:trans-aconitate methyltransferase